MIILGGKVECFVCNTPIASNEQGIIKPYKKTDMMLSDGTYTTVTTCQTCNITPDNYPGIEEKMMKYAIDEMKSIMWDEDRKYDYINRFKDLKIMGYK